MDGFISFSSQLINEQNVNYIFISRRSCFRTGARYHVRGSDPQGSVANFVETEQIIECIGILSSFLQTRGSIPLIWHQKEKSLKPKPIVDNSLFTRTAFSRHFEEQFSIYSKEIVISLIDQSGIESDLGASFLKETKLFNKRNDINHIKYIAFDFHSICKNNKYENLIILLEQVKDDLNRFGYYLRDSQGSSILYQKGIFRTNCIDCLDRTNVVQSMFARFMLRIQLCNLGIISHDEKIEDHLKLDSIFNHIWADNADAISEQYTGTGAMKTDFTRNGKRSVKGIANDGITSVKRYIRNKRFQDDERQESIDLFLGIFLVGKRLFLSTNGITRFNVLQVEEDDIQGKDPVNVLLEIDINNLTLTESIIESGQKNVLTFSSLKRLEKSIINYNYLRLIEGTSPIADCFLFESSLQRQKFIELINKHCLKVKKY
jgi:hypothetical protein